MSYEGQMQDVAVTAEEPQYESGPPAPPAASYAPQPSSSASPAAAAGETGFTVASAKRVFTSPPGILRVAEWFCFLIAFAAIVDSTCDFSGPCPYSYSDYSQFEYGVAIGVLVWLYSSAMIVVMLLNLYEMIAILPLAELAADGLFAFLAFVAGIAVAARCDDNICDHLTGGVRAGAAFLFLGSFALMGSTFFSFQQYRTKA